MLRMNSNYELNKVQSFIKSNSDVLGGSIDGQFKSSVDTIKINIAWLDKNLNKIRKYFS